MRHERGVNTPHHHRDVTVFKVRRDLIGRVACVVKAVSPTRSACLLA